MLETKHLEAILALAQTGSFHKAAAALYISQPALSTALKKLEEQLGVTLFERNSSGVKPTPLCQSLLPLAKNIMKELSEFTMCCSEYSLLQKLAVCHFPLTISAYPLTSAALLPEVLASLKARIPELDIAIRNIPLDERLPTPEPNELLISIERTDEPTPLAPGLKCKSICALEPMVCLHKDYLQPLPAYLDEPELIQLPIITILKDKSHSSLVTTSIMNHLYQLKSDLKVIDVTSATLLISFLQRQLGVGFSLQFDFTPMRLNGENIISLPLRHTNPQTFALSLIYTEAIPEELVTLLIQLFHSELLRM